MNLPPPRRVWIPLFPPLDLLLKAAAVCTVVLLCVGWASYQQLQHRRRSRVGMTLRSLQDDLLLYRMKYGRYPTTEEGLEPLVRSGIRRQLPTDPWSRPIGYRLNEDGYPLVWCLAQDGKPGGTGWDADLLAEPRQRL
ncbi:MAG TPA: type II secretion system protein GspG [Myxococcaceae bacterium]|jgi:type II secretory pathway pseudopilin PulG